MQNKPLVSVIMLTYNHAPYLKEAIEGVLMQKTNFEFELIICNDASPDNSSEIIKALAEKYPNIIRYFYHEKNIGFEENQRFAFEKCRGKYVAYCEGDDYWTDENKLQFQFDFLEQNPDYVMTTARTKAYLQNTCETKDDGKDSMFRGQPFVDYTQESFFRERPTQTLTYLIRKDAIDLKWIDIYPDYRDLYYFYHALEFGKGRAFNKIVGVYRLHDGGVFSALDIEKQLNTSINLFKNIKKVNNDNRADVQILKDYDTLINKYYYIKNFPVPIANSKLYQKILERFILSGNFGMLIRQLLKIIKYSFK